MIKNMEIKHRKSGGSRVVPCRICSEDTTLVNERLCWDCFRMVNRFNRLAEWKVPDLLDRLLKSCEVVADQYEFDIDFTGLKTASKIFRDCCNGLDGKQ